MNLTSVQKVYETHNLINLWPRQSEKCGINLVNTKESEEDEMEGDSSEEKESEYKGSDPLTYVFWGLGMLLYAGYLIIKGYGQPINDYWLLFYLVQPILFTVFGIYIIRYGFRRNREIRVVIKRRTQE